MYPFRKASSTAAAVGDNGSVICRSGDYFAIIRDFECPEGVCVPVVQVDQIKNCVSEPDVEDNLCSIKFS